MQAEKDQHEVPKQSTARRGKARTVAASVASRRTAVGEADGSFDRAFAECTSLKKGQASNGKLKEELDTMDPERVRAVAGGNVASILEVCKNSGNLSGPYIKQLEVAAKKLQEVVDSLLLRGDSEETAKLRRDSRVLRRQVEDLRVEAKAWKQEAERRAKPPPLAPTPQVESFSPQWQEVLAAAVEKIEHSLRSTMVSVIDARFEGLEGRLLPERTLRPPLASDSGSTAGQSAPNPKKRKGPNASVPTVSRILGSVASASSASQVNCAPAASPLGLDWASLPAELAGPGGVVSGEAWSVVARRPKKVKSAPQAPAQPVAPTQTRKAPVDKASPKLPTKPRTAGIIMTLQPEAVARGIDYTGALLTAREVIGPAVLGIDGLKLRKTVTGARIFEIPGADGQEKAAALEMQLKLALADVAVVSRPVKKVDIRIVDLDETVSKQDVLAAVSGKTGCPPEQIRMGEVRHGEWGNGVVHLSLPVDYARQLVEAGRLLIGWTGARIHALQEKPLRCFRCMGLGHARPLCQSEVERNALCFRCGKAGHMAHSCGAEKLHCAVCADAGRPSEHYMGGAYCRPPSTKGRMLPTRGVRVEGTVSAPPARVDSPRQEAAVMET